MWRIKHLLAGKILVICTILFTAFYSFFVEPSWVDITHISKNIGLKGDRFRIAQLSDLHISKIGATEKNTLIALDEIGPDLILLSGDVIDNPRNVEHLEFFLKSLPKVIKIAILGNWEHWSGIDLAKLQDLYKRNDVVLLINSCIPLVKNSVQFSLAGLDDFTAGKPKIENTLRKCSFGYPIIVAQHSPAMFDEDPSPELGKIIFNLAGHTHGGQIAIGQYAIFTPRGSGRFVAGSYRTKWGDLYVSRGVGTSVIPLRLGARPEIVVLDLD